MDVTITIPSRTNSEVTNIWRWLVSLIIALGVHTVLIVIPVTLAPDTTTSIPPPLEITLLTTKNTETLPASNTEHSTNQAKPQEIMGNKAKSPEKVGLEQSQAITQTDIEERAKPVSRPEVPPAQTGESMPPPKFETFPAVDTGYMDNVTVDPGAKRQATVFDPLLEKKLARERNKVRKFQPEEANYTTATGTFVQVGDRCFDVKDLPAGNTDSDLNPWFKAKCPNNSRSQAEIDRLAEKYGIP